MCFSSITAQDLNFNPICNVFVLCWTLADLKFRSDLIYFWDRNYGCWSPAPFRLRSVLWLLALTLSVVWVVFNNQNYCLNRRNKSEIETASWICRSSEFDCWYNNRIWYFYIPQRCILKCWFCRPWFDCKYQWCVPETIAICNTTPKNRCFE